VKALFIHRSVGQNFLEDAQVRRHLGRNLLHDLNVNTNVFTDEKGQQVASIISVDNGNTNPDGLAAFFAKASQDKSLEDALMQYDVIAFKSCYTANQFKTDQALRNAQAAYGGAIRDFIAAHPDTKFLIMSPPPRRPALTTRAAAKRAQSFADFLGEYTRTFKNAHFYDLFAVLADDKGCLRAEYRRLLPVDQHPNLKGSKAAGQMFNSCLRATVAPAALVKCVHRNGVLTFRVCRLHLDGTFRDTTHSVHVGSNGSFGELLVSLLEESQQLSRHPSENTSEKTATEEHTYLFSEVHSTAPGHGYQELMVSIENDGRVRVLAHIKGVPGSHVRHAWRDLKWPATPRELEAAVQKMITKAQLELRNRQGRAAVERVNTYTKPR